MTMTLRQHRTILSLLLVAGSLATAVGLTMLRDLGAAHAQAPVHDTGLVAPPDSRALPAPRSATVPPDLEADPGGFVRYGYDAATSGRWKVFAGVLLLAIAYALRRGPIKALAKVRGFTWAAWFQTRLGGFVLAFAIALAGTYGLALAVGVPLTALLALDAFVTTATAAGMWQWLQLQRGARSV